MHGARGRVGGDAPPCRSVCCRRWQQHFFGMRAAGSIRARPIGFPPVPPLAPPAWGGRSLAAGRKSLRARRVGCAAPPPVRPRLPASCSSGGGRPLREAPAIKIFSSGGGWFLRGHSAAALPSPVALWPAEVGGACLPCGRLKPPPLLRPRPPINVWGRGLSHCPAGVSPLRRGRCCACAALRHNILCHPCDAASSVSSTSCITDTSNAVRSSAPPSSSLV